VTPIIFENLKDIQLAEIDFDGGNLKNIDIKIPPPTNYGDIKLNLENTGNDMELVAKNLAASLTSDFSYKFGITVKGKADVNIKNMGVDFAIGLSTQPGTPSYDTAPLLKVDKTNVNINPDDIDIKLTGGLVSKIASVFIPFFKSTLIPMIITDMETQIKSIVETTIDQGLAVNGTQALIPYLAGVTFDYAQMSGGPQISTDSVFSMALNGTFFDAEAAKPSQYTPAAFNIRDPKGKMFQGYVTDYTLNTAFESGFQTGNTLDITYLIQHYLNYNITSDQLGVLIPEVLTKYGSGKTVEIAGSFAQAASVTHFSTTGQTVEGSLAAIIKVDGEEAIVAEFDNISVDGVITSKGGSVFGSISKCSIGTIGAKFSTTLGLTAAQLNTEL